VKRRGKRRGFPSSNLSHSQGKYNMITPFRIYYANTVTNSASAQFSEQNLQVSNMGARVVDLAEGYSEFRILHLDIESLVNCHIDSGQITPSEAQSTHAVAFTATNIVDFTNIGSFATMVDLPFFNYGNNYHKISLHIGASGLYQTTPSKWYNVSTTTSNFSAGAITLMVQNDIVNATLSTTQRCVVSGMIEFRNPIDPANVPLDVLRERKLNLEQRIKEKENLIVESKEELKQPILSRTSTYEYVSTLNNSAVVSGFPDRDSKSSGRVKR
jgi:hypothetical protein